MEVNTGKKHKVLPLFVPEEPEFEVEEVSFENGLEIKGTIGGIEVCISSQNFDLFSNPAKSRSEILKILKGG